MSPRLSLRFDRPGRSHRTGAIAVLLAALLTIGMSVLAPAVAHADGPGPSTHRTSAKSAPDFTNPAAAGIGPSRNKGFVTRSGSELELDGSPFHFSGTNIYWLGLDENVPPGTVDYPTAYRIRDAIDTAANMGAKVVRSDMFISSGGPLTLLPSTTGAINEQAWATIDYAIAYAGSKGIRLILPLTDQWTYYHGGIRDFAKPYGLCTDPNADCPAFYSDPRVISDFQSYITTVLDHVNPYTGRALKDDPTIMSWELGNELNNMTPSWIDTISQQLKTEARHQLVSAGRQFNVDDDALAAPDVDIVDVHYYPPTVASVEADAQTVTAAGKVYLAGEYDSNTASAVLPGLVGDSQIGGALSWSLFGHDDTSGFVQHSDGFTIHYPGDDAAMQANVTAQETYAQSLGRTPKPVITRAPVITSINDNFGLHDLAWRGATGANGYLIQRQASRHRWQTLTADPVGDAPWLDTSTHGTATYRVVPVDANGHRGPASDPVTVGATEQVNVDAVGSLTPLLAHSGVTDLPYGEDAVIVPIGKAGGSATWSQPELSAVTLTVVSGSHKPALSLAAGTPDGSFTSLAAHIARAGGGSWTVSASVPAGADRLRVTWPAGAAATSTGLTRVLLRSIPDQPVLTDPLNDLSLLSSHAGDLGIDNTNVSLLGNDPARLFRQAAGSASATWTVSTADAPDGLTGFDATAYYWPDQPGDPLTFAVSTDGNTWTTVTPTDEQTLGASGGNWTKDVYSVHGLSGIREVRVTWPDDSTPEWAQQLGDIEFLGASGQLTAPGAVSTTAPADGTSDVRGTPTLTWAPAARTAVYQVTLSPNADLSDPVATTQTSGTSFLPDVTLNESTQYFWQVSALNGAGTTTSPVASFTTATRPTTPFVAEDFESFASSADLAAAYVRNSSGDDITPSLVPSGAGAGHGNAMQLDYTIGSAGYAGVSRTFATPESWWGYDALTLWMDRSAVGAGQTVSVQIMTSDGSFYQADLPQTGPVAAGTVTIPLTDFLPTSFTSGEPPLDLTKIAQLSFYLGGTAGAGTIAIDDVTAVRTTS